MNPTVLIEFRSIETEMFLSGFRSDYLISKLVIMKMIKGESCDFESSKLSKREWNELMDSFGFKEKMI